MYSEEDYNCPNCKSSNSTTDPNNYWGEKCLDCGYCYETPDV